MTKMAKQQREGTIMKTTAKRTTNSQSALRFEIVTLTPERAAELVANNPHNRSVNNRLVQRLKATIDADEFQFNAQPIQIASDGTLLDGQHRLLACIASGKPIEVLVVWNALPASQETMDMGKSRTVADILRLRGHKHQNAVAALGRRIALAQSYGFNSALFAGHREISPGAIVRTVENLAELPRYLNYGKGIAELLKFNSGLTGFLIWWLDQIDRTDSDYFWDKLHSGEGLRDGDPIYALRQFALNRDPKNRGTYPHNIQTAGVVLKAWNRFRLGEPTQRIGFRTGGANPEEMPKAI
jgi:hypothetical protein